MMRAALALVLFLALGSGAASAAVIGICNGVMNNQLSSGTYISRCSQAWTLDDSSYFWIQQIPNLYQSNQNRIIAVEDRVTELEAAVGTTPADPMDAELWLSHLGGLLGAYVVGLAFGGLQAWVRAIFHKMEGIQ